MDKHLRAFLIRLPRGVRPHLGAYEPVVQKVIQKMQEILPVIQEQQREAGKLVDGLLARYQPQERRTGIRRSRKLQTWAVAEELCRRSRNIVFSDPKEAAHLGQLGIEAAMKVEAGTPAVGDLRAFCFATVGNAFRVLRWYDQSSEHFELAYQHLHREGAGDIYAQADVFSLHASLLKDQQHYGEALAVLAQAIRVLRREGDERRLARCLIKRACMLGIKGDRMAAIRVYYDALQVLDDHRDPWLTFFATQNLASLYCDLGNYKLARSALRTLSEEVIREALGPSRESNRLHLVWTRARIAVGFGQRAQALKMLDEVERGFLALPDPINAGLAALDAAKLHHKARHHAQVTETLRRVHAALKAHDFPAQLRQMAAMLVEAAEERRLLQHSLEVTAQKLQRLRARRPC